MTRKILVAYASKHNATAEIASAIGETLRQASDIAIDVDSVEMVKDLAAYDVVVLGSAVYGGQWQPSATDFLRQHEQELTQRPVWLFSSGPVGRSAIQAMMAGASRIPQAIQPLVERIKPRDVAIFPGRADPSEIHQRNLVERVLNRVSGITPGADYRDWNVIRTWATTIARAI